MTTKIENEASSGVAVSAIDFTDDDFDSLLGDLDEDEGELYADEEHYEKNECYFEKGGSSEEGDGESTEESTESTETVNDAGRQTQTLLAPTATADAAENPPPLVGSDTAAAAVEPLMQTVVTPNFYSPVTQPQSIQKPFALPYRSEQQKAADRIAALGKFVSELTVKIDRLDLEKKALKKELKETVAELRGAEDDFLAQYRVSIEDWAEYHAADDDDGDGGLRVNVNVGHAVSVSRPSPLVGPQATTEPMAAVPEAPAAPQQQPQQQEAQGDPEPSPASLSPTAGHSDAAGQADLWVLKKYGVTDSHIEKLGDTSFDRHASIRQVYQLEEFMRSGKLVKGSVKGMGESACEKVKAACEQYRKVYPVASGDVVDAGEGDVTNTAATTEETATLPGIVVLGGETSEVSETNETSESREATPDVGEVDDDNVVDDPELDTAFVAGCEAKVAGDGIRSNPYPSGTVCWHEWDRGWREVEVEE